MKSYHYKNRCNTYKELSEKISNDVGINNSEYFFFTEIDNKKYGIFNESSFKIFEDAIKDKKEDIEIFCREKKEMIKEYKENSSNKTEVNSFDISNLKKDEITKDIDDIINEYIEKYTSCLEEIKQRKEDLTTTRVKELEGISYNEKANDMFIDQITYENVIKNCGPLPVPDDNLSRLFRPQNKEICNYCGTNDIKILYGCETCKIKICEYCYQGLKTYQHYHKLSLYKTI